MVEVYKNMWIYKKRFAKSINKTIDYFWVKSEHLVENIWVGFFLLDVLVSSMFH